MKTSIYMKRKAARKAKRVKCDLRKEIFELQRDLKALEIPFPYKNISKMRAKELTGWHGRLKDIAMRAVL